MTNELERIGGKEILIPIEFGHGLPERIVLVTDGGRSYYFIYDGHDRTHEPSKRLVSLKDIEIRPMPVKDCEIIDPDDC